MRKTVCSTTTGVLGFSEQAKFDAKSDVVMGRVSYKFNWAKADRREVLITLVSSINKPRHGRGLLLAENNRQQLNTMRLRQLYAA
jgi:hypothetical protein